MQHYEDEEIKLCDDPLNLHENDAFKHNVHSIAIKLQSGIGYKFTALKSSKSFISEVAIMQELIERMSENF